MNDDEYEFLIEELFELVRLLIPADDPLALMESYNATYNAWSLQDEPDYRYILTELQSMTRAIRQAAQ